MSSLISFGSSHLGRSLAVVPRRTFTKKSRPFQERMKQELEMHKHRRLALALRKDNRPSQFQAPKLPPDPIIKTQERKLPPLSQYQAPFPTDAKGYDKNEVAFGTWNDPLFDPHMDERRHHVNPNEEPFNAIYQDSPSEAANDYTQVRDITSPELWSYVDRLARIKVAPPIRRRKAGEPPTPLPSGWVPPPETPPDLPYFVARTRNYLLPVYYSLSKDELECKTIIKFVTGDIWKFEEDLRSHLESMFCKKGQRILSSVQEPDERLELRGRYLHEVVDWLHAQGF